MDNTTTMTPAGCTTLFPWEDRRGEPYRVFIGTVAPVIETPTGTISAYVEGIQTPAGVVRRLVVLGDGDLTAGQVRDHIAMLGAMLPELEVAQ